ncbi:MAG: DUF4157 domain-containing protein [Myxococcales bacterium]|nr:DUF4157 domain-containing protein [Myxococcales bacterium]
MTHRADHDAAGTDDYAPPPSARGGAPGKSTLTSRLWRSARRDDRGVAPGAEEAVAGLGGGGAPLPAGVRDRFEASLGADLGAVRVHTDDASATAADAVGARAFARGNDIHFGAGQYQPDDPFGMHLLAHEVAHTVQQSGGAATTQYKLAVSSPGDAAEVEADRAADAMVKGEAASVQCGATGVFDLHRDAKPEAKAAPAPAYSETYNEHFDNALAALGSILSEQVVGVQELKESVDPENIDQPMTDAIVSGAVTLALSAGLGKIGEKIGEQITARIKDPANAAKIKKVVESTLDDAKGKAAKLKVADAKRGAVAFFEGLSTILAAAKNKAHAELRHQKSSFWNESDVAGSEAKAAGIQASLEALTSRAKAMQLQESFDAFTTLLSKAELGDHYNKAGAIDGTDMFKAGDTKGVLALEIVCNQPGSYVTIKSAKLPGVSKSLRAKGKVDSLDGRNLASIKIPKVVKGKVGNNAPWYDVDAGEQSRIDVRVNEQGVIWIGDGTNKGGRAWLAQRVVASSAAPVLGSGGKLDAVMNAPTVTDDNVYKGAELLLRADMGTLTLGGLF